MREFLHNVFRREAKRHEQRLLETQLAESRDAMRGQASRLKETIDSFLIENDRIRLGRAGGKGQ